LAGFSTGTYLANAVAEVLQETTDAFAGLVVVDPPLHADVVAEWRDSGKIANPIHIVHGREGMIALLDPVTSDRALFGLQLFALSRHSPPSVDVPRLFIGSGRERFSEGHWIPRDGDTVVLADERHLDFVRRPDIVTDALSRWDVWQRFVDGGTDVNPL
jgi:hypothetical protein